jgi:hypothetical protein
MTSKGLESFSKYAKPSLEELMNDFNSIKRDMDTIKGMPISEESKKLPLEELRKQLNEVKEKMHECIDDM